jgi:hypothetical protein
MLLVLVVLMRGVRERRGMLRPELGITLVAAVMFGFGCGAWGGTGGGDDEAEGVEDIGLEENDGVKLDLG